ncbi:protein ABHD11-like [Uloborus diversus]|uniref:protein ABHD11-like n=1 Tax=Uloborus diversus TaxID=327109 RepID=UPI002409E734|nr:protein ABHD11-like [Uloborus diversus]
MNLSSSIKTMQNGLNFNCKSLRSSQVTQEKEGGKAAPIKLAFYVAEPENGADDKASPIIFLHGITACKELWETVPQTVANMSKRRAYVVDQRNHGDGEWSDIFTFDVLVDDILNFMDENKIKKAILIGHSMGGIVSIKTALKNPQRIEALIVEDMIVGYVDKELLGVIEAFISKSYEIVMHIPAGTDENEASQFFLVSMAEVMKIVPESFVLTTFDEDIKENSTAKTSSIDVTCPGPEETSSRMIVNLQDMVEKPFQEYCRVHC